MPVCGWDWTEGQARGPFLVVGLGESRALARPLIETNLVWSLGVNEAAAHVGPLDYGLSADLWGRRGGQVSPFSPPRLASLRKAARQTRGVYFHAALDTVPDPWLDLTRFCRVGGPDESWQPHGELDLARLPEAILPNGWSSIVPALAIAFWLGATRIGVLGCDLTDPGHGLYGQRVPLSEILHRHALVYAEAGVEVVNLSPVSRVVGLPFVSIADWAAE